LAQARSSCARAVRRFLAENQHVYGLHVESNFSFEEVVRQLTNSTLDRTYRLYLDLDDPMVPLIQEITTTLTIAGNLSLRRFANLNSTNDDSIMIPFAKAEANVQGLIFRRALMREASKARIQNKTSFRFNVVMEASSSDEDD
jgi:hypothetical protein